MDNDDNERNLDMKRMYEEMLAERRLRIQAEEKAEKAEKKAEIAEEKAVKAEKRVKTLENCLLKKSLSYAEVHENYKKTSKSLSTFDELNLRVIDHRNCVNAWDTIFAKIDQLGNGTDEKAQVHVFITTVLETIISTFNLTMIKFHHEAYLRNPNLSPDFSITSSQIAKAAWPDCLSFVECKAGESLKPADGGQSISYLTNLLYPNNEVISFSQISRLAFSALTNGRSIQFFIMEKSEEDFERYYSSDLNLFDKDCKLGCPSEGFKLLCSLLCFLASSPIPFDRIRIGGKGYDVLETFQKSESLIVGLIEVAEGDNKIECVAKCALKNDMYILSNIRKEALMYKVLNNSQVRTLKLSSISDANHLVFKEVGLGDCKSWCHNLLYASPNLNNDEKFKKFVRCFINVLDQIEKLHHFGYIHCDIRPANILILQSEEPCLIDFLTLIEYGKKFDSLQGTVLYMAEDLLREEKPFLYKRKHDIESFCYSLLDCADINSSNILLKPDSSDFIAFDFASDNGYALFADLRQKRITKLSNDQELAHAHFLDQRFVDLFFSLFEKLNTITDDLVDDDYNDFKTILEITIA